MRLRLLVFLCLAATRAAAQRVVVDAAASGVSPVGALGSVNAAPVVPLVSPLSLSVTPLSLGSILPAPQAYLVSAAAAPGAFTVPTALPVSAIAPSATGIAPSAKRAAIRNGSAVAQDSPVESLSAAANDEDAFASGRALFDEARLGGNDTPGDKELGAYLRGDHPLAYDTNSVRRFESARAENERGSTEASAHRLLEAGRDLLASAGVATNIAVKKSEILGDYTALTIAPKRDGHRFNRLAWDMLRTTGYTLEFVPSRSGALASAHPVEKAIFLPSLDLAESYEAILHEARHAHFLARLKKGSLSVFHPVLKARPGHALSPSVLAYYDYMTLEEASTHPKTLLHLLNRLRRGESWALEPLRTHAMNFGFVLENMRRNMAHLRTRANAAELQTHAMEDGKLKTPGVHWEAVYLPDAFFLFPVRDEAPAPEAPWWKKPFASKPRTPGHKAAARYAEALAALQRALVPEYNALWAAVEEKDYVAAHKAAIKLVAIAAEADKKFAAGF